MPPLPPSPPRRHCLDHSFVLKPGHLSIWPRTLLYEFNYLFLYVVVRELLFILVQLHKMFNSPVLHLVENHHYYCLFTA